MAVVSSNVTVLLGAGDGLGTLGSPQGSYPGSDFALLDINGDGKLDLVTISPDAHKVGIDLYLGDGRAFIRVSNFSSRRRRLIQRSSQPT